MNEFLYTAEGECYGYRPELKTMTVEERAAHDKAFDDLLAALEMSIKKSGLPKQTA